MLKPENLVPTILRLLSKAEDDNTQEQFRPISLTFNQLFLSNCSCKATKKVIGNTAATNRPNTEVETIRNSD